MDFLRRIINQHNVAALSADPISRQLEPRAAKMDTKHECVDVNLHDVPAYSGQYGPQSSRAKRKRKTAKKKLVPFPMPHLRARTEKPRTSNSKQTTLPALKWSLRCSNEDDKRLRDANSNAKRSSEQGGRGKLNESGKPKPSKPSNSRQASPNQKSVPLFTRCNITFGIPLANGSVVRIRIFENVLLAAQRKTTKRTIQSIMSVQSK